MTALAFLPFATAFSLSSTTRSVAASMLSVTGDDLVWVAMCGCLSDGGMAVSTLASRTANVNLSSVHLYRPRSSRLSTFPRGVRGRSVGPSRDLRRLARAEGAYAHHCCRG